MSLAVSCGAHGWRAHGVPCPVCERQRSGIPYPVPDGTILTSQAVEMRLSVLEMKVANLELAASGIETEGRDHEDGHGAKHESPTLEEGDAQNDAPDPPIVGQTP